MDRELIEYMIEGFFLLISFKTFHFWKTNIEVPNLSVWVSYLYKHCVSLAILTCAFECTYFLVILSWWWFWVAWMMHSLLFRLFSHIDHLERQCSKTEVLAFGLLPNCNYWRSFFHWIKLLKFAFSLLPGIKLVIISRPIIRPLDMKRMDCTSSEKTSQTLQFGAEHGQIRKDLTCCWDNIKEYTCEESAWMFIL